MRSIVHWVLCLGVVMISGLGAEEAVKPKPAEQVYLRFEEKPKGAALEVGVISLQHRKSGAKVDLVGAVHIGDRAYYERLNREFKGYDAVLYEMVKPADLEPTDFKGRPKSGVSMMQTFMQRQLDLAYQLDIIDYEAKNFVHADMTLKQFTQRQRERGESMFKLMVRMMREDMARRQNGRGVADISTAELLRALFSPTRSVELKYLLARQFNEMERLTSGLDGENGSVILTDRNTVALGVLEKQMMKGRKNMAIFYGAAHLPDLEKRMVENMGFERKSSRWVTAWALPQRIVPKPQGVPEPSPKE